jgi:uncharacterized protein YoxC
MKLLTPLLIIGIALGLLLVFVKPQYAQVQTVRSQVAQYDAAIAQVQAAVKQKDQLLAKKNSFNPEDIKRLQRFLPDKVDQVKWIIDVNGIANKYRANIAKIKLTEESKSQSGLGTTEVGYGATTLSFNIGLTYEDFQKFLMDIEQSLQLMDVAEITFKPATDSNIYDYTITLRTYWLKEE